MTVIAYSLRKRRSIGTRLLKGGGVFFQDYVNTVNTV